MKICFISQAISIHTQRWVTGLAKIGCEISLISSCGSEIPGVKKFIEPIYSPNPFKQYIYQHRIRKIINDINPDVVHLFGLFSLASIGTMSIIKNLSPLVISVWGSDITIAEEQRESLKSIFVKKYLLSHADIILATSHFLQKQTEKYVKLPEKVNVLHWGIDLNYFHPQKKEKDSDTVVVGFAKNLYKLSAPDILLQAFSLARKKCGKNILLKIAGKGEMETELFALSKQLEVDHFVEWTGWLSGDKLRDFYRSIDIFVMPSRRESFGMAAVEAAASGIPVIASNVGGIPEIIKDGENGILTEVENIEQVADTIVRLADDFSLRIKMGDTGRAQAEKLFDWNKTLAEMMKIYQQFSVT